MSEKSNIKKVISYGLEGTEKDCSGVLFEIPEQEVVGGQEIEISIWGISADLLRDYTLFKGLTSMGSGQMVVDTTDQEVKETMDFAETFTFQAKYPILNINSVIATSEMWYLNSGTIAVKAREDQNITNDFRRHGYSCVNELLDTPLFGSAEVKYNRSPYKKMWKWIIPTGKGGIHWFFLYNKGVLTNKFSISVPPLADGTMSKKNVLLRVVEYGTDAPIPNASVFINDVSYGKTSLNGIIPLPQIEQGVYNLRITASGYIGTDDDNLYNDEFTIY